MLSDPTLLNTFDLWPLYASKTKKKKKKKISKCTDFINFALFISKIKIINFQNALASLALCYDENLTQFFTNLGLNIFILGIFVIVRSDYYCKLQTLYIVSV